MADASSTSVHMSEDSEVDEDDEYSELDGVELYKGSSAAASTDNEEEMEAGSAPKLSASSTSSSCSAEPKEVSRDMAALLDFAEYQDDVIQYLRSVDTKHTPKYQVRYKVFITLFELLACKLVTKLIHQLTK